jgi:hypothetical protein
MGLRRTIYTVTLTAVVGLAGLFCSGGSGQGGQPSPAASPPGATAAQQGRPEMPPGHPGTLASSHAPTSAVGGAAAAGESAPAWEVPPGWRPETPSSRMRQAQYAIPAAAGDGEDGECAVFYFGPGQGGDVDSNIHRWAAQFTGPGDAAAQPQVGEVKAGSATVTRVEVAGTYHPSAMTMTGGTPLPPRPGYLLFGAILPTPQSSWFFKCTGPEKTMNANRAAFDAMIASMRTTR